MAYLNLDKRILKLLPFLYRVCRFESFYYLHSLAKEISLFVTSGIVISAFGKIHLADHFLFFCGKRVMANLVLCVKCGKWIHGRCAKVKRVTPRLGRDFVCGR